MTLHFKVDRRGRLWLLWASSVFADGEDLKVNIASMERG